MQGKTDDINNLEDLYWSKMKARLDESMPIVQDNRRPWLVPMLSLFLGLAVISTAYYAYLYKSFVPSTTLIKERIVYKDKLIQVPIWKTDDINKSTPITFAKNDPDNLDNASEAILGTQSTEQNLSSFHTSKDANLSESDILYIDALSQLEGELAYLNIEAEDYNIFTNPSAIAPKKRGVDINLGYQLSASTDFNYTGSALQAAIHIPVNNRLDITTGLGVGIMSRDYYFLPAIPKSEGQNDLPQGIAVATPGNEDIFNSLNSFKQIYIPVGMSYQLGNNLAINSGVKIRYTLQESVDEILNLPRSRKPPFEPIESGSIFANTNIGVSAGLQYRFTPRISIFLDSEWGLNPIISNPQLSNSGGPQPDLNRVNFTTSYSF